MLTTNQITRKSQLRALQVRSFPVSPTTLAQAEKLAPSVQELQTGVYTVGRSAVDAWRGKCTCKLARTQHAKHDQITTPCPHFIAVLLITGLECWHGLTLPNHTAPKITGFTCRLRHTRGRWQFQNFLNEWWRFVSVEGDGFTFAQAADVTHMQPIYENQP